MLKKMQVEKQRNGRVYIQFPYFYDLFNKKNVELVKKISALFSQEFIYKLTYRHNSKMNFSDDILKEKIYQIKKEENTSLVIFRSSISLLSQILNKMNHETDSLEVIKYNEKLDIKEDKADFIFYFSDNDGPYLIFDSNIFQYKSTILEIKKILRNN